jgi:shikimate dehydrogenase
VTLAYNQRVSRGFTESIDPSTRYCAVFGQPIGHSASPAMQNAALAALNLNWRYLAFEVHPSQLRGAIGGAKAMKFAGLNLTVPHKMLAVEMVDEIDERAKFWGAVNTIVFEARDADGQWVPLARAPADTIREIRSHGFNTDADAIVKAIIEDFLWPDLAGAGVLLLGAGGAARTAALRLAREGIDSLFLLNRTEEKAARLAAEVAAHFPSVQIHVVVQNRGNSAELNRGLLKDHPTIKLAAGCPERRVDLLLNATSLGLKAEDPLPVDANWLRSHPPRRVYDMIYRPAQTALLRAAKEAGCAVANGVSMLLYQGETALQLWTGLPAPVEVMRAALEKNVYGQGEEIGSPRRV